MVVGKLVTPCISINLRLSAMLTQGQGTLFVLKNRITSPSSLSELTPITSKPLPRYFSYALMMFGISATQGGHQVPQKSIRTTLPLRSFRLKSLPVTVVPVISMTLPSLSRFLRDTSNCSVMAVTCALEAAEKYLM